MPVNGLIVLFNAFSNAGKTRIRRLGKMDLEDHGKLASTKMNASSNN